MLIKFQTTREMQYYNSTIKKKNMIVMNWKSATECFGS